MNCKKCDSEYTYVDESIGLNICSMCGYEWNDEMEKEESNIVLDANGNVLENGDTVLIIKDLKIKGSSSVAKKGTKVKGIKLVEGDHNIDCKIEGIGKIGLKSEFVKKA